MDTARHLRFGLTTNLREWKTQWVGLHYVGRNGDGMNGPQLLTSLPGPQARAILEREERFVTPSLTRLYPFVADRGAGCRVWDVDGNCFLDFTAGLAVCATGHGHPKILEAIQAQSRKLLHFSAADFYYPLYSELAERLSRCCPGSDDKKVFLCNSGTESIEAAIKLARYHTKRQRVIAFDEAFHGRTIGALALTASKLWQQRGFGTLLGGVTHIPFGHAGLDHLEETLFRTNLPPEEVAAIFFEPIQGEGGCYVPEPGFLPRLRKICDPHGILLVADEIQTGLGRTGRMFACEHWGVVPDILCLAKALGGGLPLGAMVARAEIMDWPEGAHTSTFGGNPVACAAGLATLDLLEGGLIEHAREVSEHLRRGLEQVAEGHSLVGEVRGLGMMLGIELVKNRRTKEPATAERDALLRRAFERGLLVLGGGQSVVRLMPPLILTTEEADMGLEILKQALADVEARKEAA
jgi:4-aminobutyrate aminotransferase